MCVLGFGTKNNKKEAGARPARYATDMYDENAKAHAQSPQGAADLACGCVEMTSGIGTLAYGERDGNDISFVTLLLLPLIFISKLRRTEDGEGGRH